MAPSFDCAVSSLLCAEDNISIFDDDNNKDYCYGDVVDEFEGSWHHGNHRINHQDRGFDVSLPMLSEECLRLMVEKECQHLPNADYLKRLRRGELDLGARKEAIDWIGKVHAHFGFGPLSAYLSINYLDRFLSAYELPKGKDWMMQLLAVACLSIAAKMEETEVPIFLDLQVGESRFVFEARTIQRMELLVLSTLSWRMKAITPFSFIDDFLNKINNDENPPTSLILQSIQLILSIIKGIDFLEFRPSEVAAAVTIAVVGEIRTVDAEQAIFVLSQHIQKEKVLKCFQLIQDFSLIGGAIKDTNVRILSVPQSPIGVLDAACLSYRSDESTVGSCANSSQDTPEAKRKKLNKPWE
ncbi:cyclin-D4-1 [Ricinus communis]|uniref:B-like cyclin n=1 Tax=Ricinus communis TaxID=3988 RepID=B9RJU5_RICCO|nr:cyclin-D4-1 [Ricinus communis]EEF48597.1 cyclin d, putative [Ricinus communis]|eukprot:XP_002514014.1 cyclin-D4-1 [Ricinus communis]